MQHCIGPWRFTGRARLAAAALATLAITPALPAAAQPAGTPGTTITVNSTWDGFIITQPGQPLPCRLRDAIQAANTNLPVGGCAAGVQPHLVSANPLRVDGIDRIVFAVGSGTTAGTPRIQLRGSLPHITEAVTIDGATGGATRIEIAGNQIFSIFGPVHGIVVLDNHTTLKSLVINGFSGNGVLLTKQEGDGIIIVTPGRPERPDPGDFPIDPCGPNAFPSDPSQCRYPGGGPDDDVREIGASGGGGHTILNCLIGTNAAGNQAVPNGNGTSDTAGVMVLTPANTIGGTAAGSRNVISGNRGHGIVLESVNNKVTGNSIGTGVSTSTSLPNQLDGIFVAGGQFAGATCEIRSNTIAFNAGDGVDAGTNACTISLNSISGNGGLGIERADPGVTLNDPAGARSWPPNFPVLGAVNSTLGGTWIFGTMTQQGTQPITVEVFYSPTCDPSGHGEGRSYVGSTSVMPGTAVPWLVTRSTLFLSGRFTATATTSRGTSEFSLCFP